MRLQDVEIYRNEGDELTSLWNLQCRQIICNNSVVISQKRRQAFIIKTSHLMMF